MIDLSIITVTHQSADYIEDLIASVISGALRLHTEHWIVDNASSDKTVELIENNYASFVSLIKNKENLGFSAANNQAFKEVRGRYVLFLNPDMRVEEGSLDAMVQWMDSRMDVGIASCKLINPEGEFLPHRAPFPFPKFPKNLCWLIWPFFSRGKIEWDPHCKEIKQVDAVLGAFMLTRRSFLDRLGFAFDPRYFLTFEDCDLCQEAKRLGLKVVYYPFACCIDYNSRSFSQKKFLWIYAQVSRGMYLYYQKWGPWYASWLIGLFKPIGYFIRYLLPKEK
jgi:GT2 family glycosyltransferase